jgi:hypothetical protein
MRPDVSAETSRAIAYGVAVVCRACRRGWSLRSPGRGRAGTGRGESRVVGPAADDADGPLEFHRVRVDLTVSKGPFGANKIVCGSAQACLVSVMQATLSPTQEADAPIAFGLSMSGSHSSPPASTATRIDTRS